MLTVPTMLRVRMIVRQRHAGHAERPLANIDLYLGMSQRFDTRGLASFAREMTVAWTEGKRAAEDHPDAQEEAVVLVTMHAAKGLEWPVFIPINTMTGLVHGDGSVCERSTGHFYAKVFGISGAGHQAAMEAEKAELERERIRLWHVAATRACELLVLPRAQVAVAAGTWLGLLGAPLAALPPLVLPATAAMTVPIAALANQQTAAVFAQEAASIASGRSTIALHAPSRVEADADGSLAEQEEIPWVDADVSAAGVRGVAPVQGGRERGLIIHKLLEEVLTGECGDAEAALLARAEVLLLSLGLSEAALSDHALEPAELAGCVARMLRLPEIVHLRPRLLAEYPVYASTVAAGVEQVSIGVADAIAPDARGAAEVVIDWKSDVASTRDTLAHYVAQVRQYLDITGARHGLVVLVTSSKVLEVSPTGVVA